MHKRIPQAGLAARPHRRGVLVLTVTTDVELLAGGAARSLDATARRSATEPRQPKRGRRCPVANQIEIRRFVPNMAVQPMVAATPKQTFR